MVDDNGLEPLTLRTSSVGSVNNKISHVRYSILERFNLRMNISRSRSDMVDDNGLEPLTLRTSSVGSVNNKISHVRYSILERFNLRMNISRSRSDISVTEKLLHSTNICPCV